MCVVAFLSCLLSSYVSFISLELLWCPQVPQKGVWLPTWSMHRVSQHLDSILNYIRQVCALTYLFFILNKSSLLFACSQWMLRKNPVVLFLFFRFTHQWFTNGRTFLFLNTPILKGIWLKRSHVKQLQKASTRAFQVTHISAIKVLNLEFESERLNIKQSDGLWYKKYLSFISLYI